MKLDEARRLCTGAVDHVGLAHIPTPRESKEAANTTTIMLRRTFSLAMAASLVAVVDAYPGSYGDGQLRACAGGNCPNAHGSAPQQGNALTATGKTDGGTYTPGETINLANAGGGQYALYAEAGGAKLARSDDAATTVTAPASGTLTLLGIRAAGRNQCTYQTIKLTAAGGGGAGTPPGGGGGVGAGSPPPAGGIGGGTGGPPPPPAIGGGGGAVSTPGSQNQYESKDKLFTVKWQPLGATMRVTVSTKPAVGSYNPPAYVGFALSSNGKLLGSGDSPRLIVIAKRPSTLPPPVGRRLQTGIAGPPPPAIGGVPGAGGNSDVQVYLMKGAVAGSEEAVTSSSILAQCGFSNPTGATVSVNGLELTMSFDLLIQKDRSPVCTVGGLTVPALSTTSGRTSGVVAVQGSSATLTDLHTTKNKMEASRLLADGSSSSGGLPSMSTFFAAILVVVILAVGFKFYKDKQSAKGGGAQQPPPMVEIQPSAASSSQPGAPPPPQGGYGGASPWVEQRDPTTGAAYYYNTQTGQTSWTCPY